MTRGRWRALALLAAVALAALTLTPATAQGQARDGAGAITGRVVNGTPGFPVPVGIEVTLSYLDAGGAAIELTTTTDANGAFQFTGIPMTGRDFVLRADYLEVAYTVFLSGSLADDEGRGDVERLTVYETTSDLRTMRVLDNTLAVTAVDGRRRWIGVLESVRVENAGDRTFVANPAATGSTGLLRFPLLPGASSLEIETSLVGGFLIEVDGGVALSMPVPPGQHDFLLMYGASYDGASIAYERRSPMAAETFRLIFPRDSGVAESAGMERMPPVTLGERQYSVLEAHGLAPDASVMIRLVDLPRPGLLDALGDAVGSDGFRQGAVPGLAGLGMAVLLVYVVVRRWRGRPGLAAAGPLGEAPDGFDGLVDAIARLDEDHAQGRVQDAGYQERRDALMGRLRPAAHREGTGIPAASAEPGDPARGEE